MVQKQSGTSVRGKPRISKQGNSYIRRVLYFPAITAVEKNERLNNFYKRLYSRPKKGMKAYTAVQRKLLVLIFTMWKKQEVYNPDYHQKKWSNLNQLLHTSWLKAALSVKTLTKFNDYIVF